MAVKVDLDKCTGCESCVEVCPTEALKVVDEKLVVDVENCTDCGSCVDECPLEALELE